MNSFVKRAVSMYVDGFRNMTVGRDLWLLIIFKCIVIFAILKMFFFPDILATEYDNDTARADAVRETLAAPDKNRNF